MKERKRVESGTVNELCHVEWNEEFLQPRLQMGWPTKHEVTFGKRLVKSSFAHKQGGGLGVVKDDRAPVSVLAENYLVIIYKCNGLCRIYTRLDQLYALLPQPSCCTKITAK